MIEYEWGNKTIKNEVVKATITDIVGYGAFCEATYNDKKYKGLIHISEIANTFVKDIHNFVNVGDEVDAVVIGVDDKKRLLKLSLKRV